MLVLSRKENQTIQLPGLDVEIKVLKCNGSTVKLGIEAPNDVRIIRSELETFDDLFHSKPNNGENFEYELASSFR